MSILTTITAWAGGASSLLLMPVPRQDLDITLVADVRNTADQSSYTFSSVNFGAVDDRRQLVVLLVYSRSTTPVGTVTSMTVGGVAATPVVSGGTGGNTTSAMWMAAPSGTSGNIVVNLQYTQALAAIGVFRVVHWAQPSLTKVYSQGGSGVTFTGGVQKGGAAISLGVTGSNSNINWTGTTEISDSNWGTWRLSFALKNFAAASGSTSVSSNADVATGYVLR